MKIAAKTDVGKVRSSNQDSYATGELPGGVAWAVVCDGMGGVAGGNVASSVAVKMISEKITATYHSNMSTSSVKNMLVSAITAANLSIFDMSNANESLHGMGTTVVAAVIADGIVCVAHAGDSRAYLITKDELFQLTTDHSIVQAMVESGKITPDEAKDHPRKNIITRALGVAEDIDVDFCEEKLGVDDILLICTDGLTNYIDSQDILKVAHTAGYYEIADKLVSLANSNGGGDNITVVTVSN